MQPFENKTRTLDNCKSFCEGHAYYLCVAYEHISPYCLVYTEIPQGGLVSTPGVYCETGENIHHEFYETCHSLTFYFMKKGS